MQKYSIEDARKIVMNCAKQYNNNLNDRTYLVLYKIRNTDIVQYLEIDFKEENYQHLTGIELIDSLGRVRKNVSTLFYNKCIKNTLRKDEISFKLDGTAQLKLHALPALMDIHKVTKIAADYDGNKKYLIADKIIGNVNFCLGLKKLENEKYVPVSALLEDIKKITVNQSQVIMIFSKDKADATYKTIRYVAKKIQLMDLKLSPEIIEKLDIELGALK